MGAKLELTLEGFRFVLVSPGYQPLSPEAHVQVMVDAGDMLDSRERAHFLTMFEEASHRAQAFDLIVKASEFVMSPDAEDALHCWTEDALHAHAMFCTSALYAHNEFGLPVAKEVKAKLKAFIDAAQHRVFSGYRAN